MDNSSAKLPPQNIEAEASLLGSILIDPDAIVKIADIVKADDFYDKRHGLIYAAAKRLYDKRRPIDVLTLADELKSTVNLEEIGGASYLSELTNFVPSAAHALSYATIVSDKAMRRRLIKASQSIVELGYGEEAPISNIIEQAESKLFDVSQARTKQNIVSLEEVLTESFERLDELHKDSGAIRGVPTGYKDLDNILAGLQRSDLIVLAARPSMGKTALALNLAHNVAVKSAQPVLFFSPEMSKEQLVDRLLAAEAGVDAWNLEQGI